MWDYTDKVKDHFFNPRNVGEVEDPDAVGEVGSMACGDALRLSIKVDDSDRIVDAKFKTFGCGSAIASSSALTEIIKGMTVDDALGITNDDIAQYLGGLPKEKMHCSVMGHEALQAAIANFRGISLAEHADDEGKIICHCFGVSDEKIMRVARENNLRTLEDVTHYTKAGGGCSSCHHLIEDILNDLWGERPVEPDAVPVTIRADFSNGKGHQNGKLTNLQRIALIQKTLDDEIRPAVQSDGGDVELYDVEGNVVKLKMHGACGSCPSSQFTLKSFIEEKLREKVSPDLVVTEV